MAKKRKWGRVLAFGAITAALGGIAAYKHRTPGRRAASFLRTRTPLYTR